MTLGFLLFLLSYCIIAFVWSALVCDWWGKEQKGTSRFLRLDEYPEYICGYSELIGVYVNGCVLDDDKYREWYLLSTGINLGKGEDLFVGLAHAHPYTGIICVPYQSRLQSDFLMKHELAHILCDPKESHGEAFKAKLLELGGTLDFHRIPGTNVWGISHLDRSKFLDQALSTYNTFVLGPIQRLREIVYSIIHRKEKIK